MELALVGLSHKTAPVEIRERLAFSTDGVRNALAALTGRQEVNEALILSTCNRVEVVAQSTGDDTIRDFICEYVGRTPLAKSFGTMPAYLLRRAHA